MNDARGRASATLLGLALVPGISLALSLTAKGCGGQSTIVDEADGGPDADGVQVVETIHPSVEPLPGETECTVVTTTGIPVPPYTHVLTCTSVEYATNPPSSGDHWGFWAAFKEYAWPIPREVYVHDMEHGAVVLAYRCDDGCPEVVAMLREVTLEATSDPLCLEVPGSSPTRIVITPDPKLDTPIAAAAWGATYTATCIDKSSLASFVAKAYGKGPEATCFPGKDLTNPDASPACDGGGGG
jgi:hypothetical protein